MTDEDLRRRMFAAAEEMLDELGGLSLNVDGLNLETIMRRADVSRSAVYRVWPTKEDFNFDLLNEMAAPSERGAAAFDAETQKLGRDVVTANADLLSEPDGPRRVLLEAVRQAAWQNFDAITRQGTWRTFVVLALTTSSVGDDDRRAALTAKLRESDKMFTQNMADFYRELLPVLRLRPRPPFTADEVFDNLAMVGGALVEGLAIHHIVDPDIGERRFDWEGKSWSLPALGFLAVIDMMCESDDPPAA